MTSIITRPCYSTREQFRRALDVKQAAYNDEQIDRANEAAADAVEQLCQRKFYPDDGTRKWDWPNFQFAYPWRLWLEQHEMAAQPTLVTTGSLLDIPVVIPTSAIIMRPVNDGPPFTWLELRRDMNYAFGYNETPQLDIAITGTFGYWMKTRNAGTLAASMGSSDGTMTVSDGISVGVGDVVIVDIERMIVYDSTYIDTGIAYSGLSTAQASDNQVMVPSGADFLAGETLLVDSEWILIQAIYGNTMVVKRAWSGSVLAAHTGSTLWARRLLSVLRGELGTTAAAHSSAAPLTVSDVPGLVRQLSVAEAIVSVTGEPGAYSQAAAGLGAGSGLGVTVGATGRGQVKQGVPGLGLPTLRDQVANSKYARKARTRVI